MIKPLAFKGDKKSKKRKAPHPESTEKEDSRTLTLQSTTAADSEEDDSWVTAEAATDVTGPVIFVLPSAKPTCIACDANGKVFASELENIVEGDLATAEPHDVRQVFIASRIAGTEEISFKGHHGRYF
jgi:protein FRG1